MDSKRDTHNERMVDIPLVNERDSESPAGRGLSTQAARAGNLRGGRWGPFIEREVVSRRKHALPFARICPTATSLDLDFCDIPDVATRAKRPKLSLAVRRGIWPPPRSLTCMYLGSLVPNKDSLVVLRDGRNLMCDSHVSRLQASWRTSAMQKEYDIAHRRDTVAIDVRQIFHPRRLQRPRKEERVKAKSKDGYDYGWNGCAVKNLETTCGPKLTLTETSNCAVEHRQQVSLVHTREGSTATVR